MSGILSIGLTGIQVAQLGLQVTQHNIANAGTDGYNRQYLLQSSGIPQATGAGYFGSGARGDSVRRAYDHYLTQQTFSAQSRASEYETMVAKMSQIDNMLGDPTTGLATAVQSFFTGVQQVAADPSLISARQSMLSSAQVLANRFSSMSTRIDEMYHSINGEISSEAELINTYAKQIAEINGQIVRAEGAAGQPPNDLLDMRDQMVAELNKHVRVDTVEDGNGAFNVFVGSGQQLVSGAFANSLAVTPSRTDPERMTLALRTQNGATQDLPEGLIQGGALGGLLRFRAQSLDSASNSLGAAAASIAQTFNAQHALGQDLDGLNAFSTSGFAADFFKIPTQANVVASSSTATSLTMDLLPPEVNPANGGFFTRLTGSDYLLRNTGTVASPSLTLTRLSDNAVLATGAASLAAVNTVLESEGISLSGGVPTPGADYRIEPTRDIARNFSLNPTVAADPRRIAAAAPTGTALGAQNVGSLKVSQGDVGAGYSLSNITSGPPAAPRFTFASSPGGGNFTFAQGAATVTATYANGTSVNILAGSISRLNSGSELTKITFDGIAVNVAGLPANGDSFTITRSLNGSSDSRNAVRLGALQTQNAMTGGKATFQGFYASLVSKVGTDTREAKVNGEAQQTLLAQNEQARQSVSGVNLDEEAANLIKFQQAYQASAKSLDIASKLFDVLLGIGR